MRIMAVDYGDSRTGVAFSDITRTIAGDAFTIHEKDMNVLVKNLCGLCKQRDVGRIVVGNPKHMNADEGVRSAMAKQLAERLGADTGLPVTLWDERLTSVDAHRILSENNRRGAKRKASVDAVAASLILENYLRTGGF